MIDILFNKYKILFKSYNKGGLIVKYDTYKKERLEYLKDFIANSKKRPVLFVGSGFSKRYLNLPSWKKLLDILFSSDKVSFNKPLAYYLQMVKGDYPKVADKLIKKYSNYYWDNTENNPEFLYEENESVDIFLKYEICNIISKLSADIDNIDVHNHAELKYLTNVQPQMILTTNYDQLLEKVFPKYDTFIGQDYLSSELNDFKIMKIHGSITDPKSIVIDNDDYNSFRTQQEYTVAKLITYFVEYPIIFIGYSISDSNIREILNSVSKIIGSKQDNSNNIFLNNIFFVEWNESEKDPQNIDIEKLIDLGQGNSVKVNYLYLNGFSDLYNTLAQKSIDINVLKTVNKTIDNIIKSSSITDLKVDIASIDYLKDPQTFLSLLQQPDTLLSLSTIQSPDQLSAQFYLSPSELAKKAGYSNWQPMNRDIDKISSEYSIKLRKETNPYHVVISGGVTRYSDRMISLLLDYKKHKNLQKYFD